MSTPLVVATGQAFAWRVPELAVATSRQLRVRQRSVAADIVRGVHDRTIARLQQMQVAAVKIAVRLAGDACVVTGLGDCQCVCWCVR